MIDFLGMRDKGREKQETRRRIMAKKQVRNRISAKKKQKNDERAKMR